MAEVAFYVNRNLKPETSGVRLQPLRRRKPNAAD